MTKSKTTNAKKQQIETNSQRVISDWVNAINDFNQWNSKLVNIIDAHILVSEDVVNSLGRLGNQRVMSDLIELRFALINVLDKLLNDVNRIEKEQDTPAKIDNLCKQTRIINHWNEKIRQAIEINGCGIS